MNTEMMFTRNLFAMSLLFAAGMAQACYYEGDPVLTTSGYDVPKSVAVHDCYYGGDPVMSKSEQHAGSVTLVEGSYYYYADRPEADTVLADTQGGVEFSAFEPQAETPKLRTTEALESDVSAYDWIPETWDGPF